MSHKASVWARFANGLGSLDCKGFLCSIFLVANALPQALAQAPEEQGRSSGHYAEQARIHIADAEIPFSSYASPEARQAMAELRNAPPGPGPGAGIEAIRSFNEEIESKRLLEVRKLYSASVASETIGGIGTDVLSPDEGIPDQNRDRVLIGLHAGGFMWGAGAGALAEAIPIAATARIKVVAIDYRMAPEYKFPAATEDVAAVYRALLESYSPQNIGIFGCSAGGILAAQSVAWFAKNDLPQPGAIVCSCATGAEVRGDTAYLAPMLTGQPIPPGGKPLLLSDLPYFAGVDPGNPLAFPIVSPDVLAQFPPTLLIAGSRDFSASSLTVMHRRLRKADVHAELFLFDGLWHAFLLSPSLPESQEAYEIISRFFNTHLGRASRLDR